MKSNEVVGPEKKVVVGLWCSYDFNPVWLSCECQNYWINMDRVIDNYVTVQVFCIGVNFHYIFINQKQNL